MKKIQLKKKYSCLETALKEISYDLSDFGCTAEGFKKTIDKEGAIDLDKFICFLDGDELTILFKNPCPHEEDEDCECNNEFLDETENREREAPLYSFYIFNTIASYWNFDLSDKELILSLAVVCPAIVDSIDCDLQCDKEFALQLINTNYECLFIPERPPLEETVNYNFLNCGFYNLPEFKIAGECLWDELKYLLKHELSLEEYEIFLTSHGDVEDEDEDE